MVSDDKDQTFLSLRDVTGIEDQKTFERHALSITKDSVESPGPIDLDQVAKRVHRIEALCAASSVP